MTVKVPRLSLAVICAATVYLAGDRGQTIPFGFEVHFKRLPTSERNRLNEWFIKGRPTGEIDAQGQQVLQPFAVSDLMDEAVVGWNLADADGTALTYSREARLAQENDLPGLEQAMAVAWFDHLFINQREAATKNSGAPFGTGSGSTAPTATS